jgi:polyisoprenyl-teichoic acid--peptidoglycan teichoic acid transferase
MINSRTSKRKKKRSRIAKSFMTFIVLLLVAGGSYFAYDILYNAKKASDNIYQEIDSNKIPSHRTEEVKVTKDPFTILLVGIEGQKGGSRSDVVLLATVNPQTEEVYMLSIPRDTRLYIPEVGYKDKITHSYGHGGIESTIGAVHELIDIPIDYYIQTNFDGFEDIVDTLDGVKVDVPFTFKAQLTGSLQWKTYPEGEMELNGNEALAYVRMRKSDPTGDIGRNERQQQVIKAIVDKGTSLSSITKVDDILQDLGENVKTNIPPSKFVSFMQLYSKIKNTQIQNLKLDGYNEMIDNVYYYIPKDESIEELNTTLQNALKSKEFTSSTPTSKIQQAAGNVDNNEN